MSQLIISNSFKYEKVSKKKIFNNLRASKALQELWVMYKCDVYLLSWIGFIKLYGGEFSSERVKALWSIGKAIYRITISCGRGFNSYKILIVRISHKRIILKFNC